MRRRLAHQTRHGAGRLPWRCNRIHRVAVKRFRASGVLELPRDEPEVMALDAILNFLKSSTSKREIRSGFPAGER